MNKIFRDKAPEKVESARQISLAMGTVQRAQGTRDLLTSEQQWKSLEACAVVRTQPIYRRDAYG